MGAQRSAACRKNPSADSLSMETRKRPNFSGRPFTSSMSCKASKPAELIRIDGFNHFEVMDAFADPKSRIARTALKHMGLDAWIRN